MGQAMDIAGIPPIGRIQVVVGDITQLPPALEVDAVVNAANEMLLGGGGVDGAIHRAAGPRLLAHNRTLGGCPTGEAKITPAFDLEARGVKHIIHTVGPVWSGKSPSHAGTNVLASVPLGDYKEDVLLAGCYLNSLVLAEKHHVQAIAFPAISTGVYRFPRERAARIAAQQTLDWLSKNDMPARVVFCCFTRQDAAVYDRAIIQLGK